jgi:hypothetical protein
MNSWILETLVVGAAVGIGAIGAQVLGAKPTPKPIPIRVRKERRR